jgi:sugar phosphate isomerase/epimerase
MAKMQNVERVYLHSNTSTSVTKTKRHDYKHGGYRLEVRQILETYCLPYALLSCGHTRKWQAGENFTEAKRLSCHYCDSISWHTETLESARGGSDEESQIAWLAEAEESARKNEELVAEHAETWVDYA